MLCGWIDNTADLARTLNVPFTNPETVYGAAVEKWGLEADRYVVGSYASLICMPDQTVRLARSPWNGKSLFFYRDDDTLLTCSIVRPLFASGVPKRLDPEEVDKLLCMELPSSERSLFSGIGTVPAGAVILFDRERQKTHRFYDPLAVERVRLRSDADCLEAANAMIGEAVSKAIAPANRPAIALSGGLDSPVVCDEILRQLAPNKQLSSFTFHPLKTWDGKVAPHKFGDDRPFVEAFAAMHPALDAHFVDGRDVGFDHRAEELFLATDSGYPASVLSTVYFGVYEAAREHGCDWLFGAGCGNLTFSNSAPWAYAEFLRTGQWQQLWALAASHINDPRPIWRRIASHGLMPLLPPSMGSRVRRFVHGGSEDLFANPFLKQGGRLSPYRSQDFVNKNIMTLDSDRSREDYIQNNYEAMGTGNEMIHGHEQVFGIKMRDITAYRPLIELCLGLPTEQFVRNGQTRFLARRMAAGRMPEQQRTNRLYGEHNVDWHARLTPRREQLLAQTRNLANHPDLGPLIDTDRVLDLLENWPETTPDDPAFAAQLRFFLPAVLYVARYVDFETGRNRPHEPF